MTTKKKPTETEEPEVEETPTINGVETTAAFADLWQLLGDRAPFVMGNPEGPVQTENTGRPVQRFARGWFIEIDGKAEALGFAAAPHLMQ